MALAERNGRYHRYNGRNRTKLIKVLISDDFLCTLPLIKTTLRKRGGSMTNSKKVKMSLNIKDWLLKAQLIFV